MVRVTMAVMGSLLLQGCSRFSWIWFGRLKSSLRGSAEVRVKVKVRVEGTPLVPLKVRVTTQVKVRL